MVDTPFVNFQFNTTGASALRTMPDRLAEVVNVKDFGAKGDSTDSIIGTNDSVAIQAAFNAAFMTSGAPNGLTNSYRNRAVFFPNGVYYCGGLTLNSVYGGRIFGSGDSGTRLRSNASTGAIITATGFSNSTIENINFLQSGHNNAIENVGLELLSDGGSVGLNSSAIINCGFGNAKYGVRVAESGIDGQGISFMSCQASDCIYAIKLNSDSAMVNVVGGGYLENFYAFWNCKGNLAINGPINAGPYKGNIAFPGQTDILHSSSGITTQIGSRSESQNFLYIAPTVSGTGKVNIYGFTHNLANNPGPPAGTYGPVVIPAPGGFGPTTINGTGGQVVMNGCLLGNYTQTNTGLISGSGYILSIRNVNWAGGGNPFVNFTANIASFIAIAPFTFATLPLNPVSGLTVTITDARTNTGAWGETLVGSGGTLVGNALVRYNGSTWTLVGK